MCNHLYVHVHQHCPSLLAHSPNIFKKSATVNIPGQLICPVLLSLQSDGTKKNGNCLQLLGQCEADVNQFLCLFFCCPEHRRHTESREGKWSGSVSSWCLLLGKSQVLIDSHTANPHEVFSSDVKTLAEIIRLLKLGLGEHMLSFRLLDEFLLVVLSLT